MTNWEKYFGDCDKVSRGYIGETINNFYECQCARKNFVTCEGCRFNEWSCNALDKYDASMEWLKEEADD